MTNTNDTITSTTDNEIISLASVTCEELDHSHEDYMDELRANREPREDNFHDDVDADANALASAGWGTDEDYGYFENDNGWD